MKIKLNPRIALLFLRTRVALGGKKPPSSLSRKTTNVFFTSSTVLWMQLYLRIVKEKMEKVHSY